MSGFAAELNNALKTASQHWEEARTTWRDGVADQFEGRYWRPLENQTQAVIHALERLSPLLAQAERECS